PSLLKQIKRINELSSDAKKNAEIFKRNFDALTAADGDKTIPSTLLSMEKDKFDKTIDKYLDNPDTYPAASALKAEFHKFVDYVDLTNKRREYLTALAIKVANSYNQIVLLQIEANKL